jgi:hypothetical protein
MIYDQQSATNRLVGGADYPFQAEQPSGQSFTPTLSSIGFVQFEFLDPQSGNGVGATVYVNLRADSLNGPILGSTDPVSMPDGFSLGVTNFFFGTPVPIIPGTTYYLQPVLEAGEGLWTMMAGPLNYPGGTFFEYGSPDPNGYDAWFREGVLIPEPSSGLLALGGGAGVWAACRLVRRKKFSLLLVVLATVGVCCASAQTNLGSSYFSSAHPEWPPLPEPTPGCAVSPLPGGQQGDWLMADLGHDYDASQSVEAPSLSLTSASPMGPAPDGPQPDGLWLEITANAPDSLSLVAHNVDISQWFQLESTTDMQPQPAWTIEQNITRSSITDLLLTVAKGGRPRVFFRAAQSYTRLFVTAGDDALRPGSCYPGQRGYFTIQRAMSIPDWLPPLTVYYQMGGTAANGVDYTYLNGIATIPENASGVQVEVDALQSLVTSDMTVTLTLVPTNGGYLVDQDAASATIVIKPNVFSKVASVPNPVGLDYHPLLNSLVASETREQGAPNFVQINSQGVVSAWASVADLYVSVPIATVKATQNGFTVGDMFYGTLDTDPIHVGWLAADGSQYNNTWASLPGYLPVLGGLYLDQTGVFGGDLIATTGGDYSGPPGTVWRVTSSRNATEVASFPEDLSGVITLPNDPAQWGEWAGKIITGQGPETFLPDPEIYAIGPNGQVATYHLGIQPEHFNLIPANQAFYCCDAAAYAVWKVPAGVFANHVGHLLITGMGERGYFGEPALYVVHYDASAPTHFVVEKITTPDFIGCFEEGTFAPIDIPCVPQ